MSSITQRRINDKMIAKVALLCLVAVAVSAKVEMEYHPQAVLHYLELKDQHLARKVRGMLKLDADFPKPSPTSLPPGISKGLLVSILVKSCAALQYSKPSKVPMQVSNVSVNRNFCFFD